MVHHEIPWTLAILFFVGVAAVALIGRWAAKPGTPYQAAGPLLSPAEAAFLTALEAAVRNRYRVYVKVRIADLVSLRKGLSPKTARAALNRIAAKHADFVLCDHRSFQPSLVVELDDASHQRGDRRRRDEFVDRAFSAAGLPLVRIKARGRYSIEDLERELFGTESASARTAPSGVR